MKLAIILTIAVAGYCSNTRADCYTRSNIRMTRSSIDAGPTDVQKLIVPDSNGSRCVARYRVHINDMWYSAEGSSVAKTESEACARALDVGIGTVLAEVEPNTISSDTQMVCSDLPDIRIRPVHIGEVIWESETDMHRHPQERKYFDYKQTKCRMFTERNAKDRNLYTYQGIICKVDSGPYSKWRVVDKY
jgi:hypothetical protein